MAEWSKALVSGTSLFGGVGSNPTSCILVKETRAEKAKEEGIGMEIKKSKTEMDKE